MISEQRPYYTYNFGSMGRTLETAKQTGLFAWFHLTQTEQTTHPAGQVTRFRPSGASFHDLCYLDILEASDKALLQMELVVRRAFIDGRNGLFAQDLVKSFLVAALPDACQHLLADFIQEIKTPGIRRYDTDGGGVFSGRLDQWSRQTGWSRLMLSNVPIDNEPVFVVRVCPNPEAPNARRIE